MCKEHHCSTAHARAVACSAALVSNALTIAHQDYGIHNGYLRFSKHWILGAALVLTVDWVVSMDRAHPSDLIASKRLYVTDALDIFRQHQIYPLDKTPQMTVQCARIVEALLAVADRRAVTRLLEPSCESTCQPDKEIQDFFDAVSAALLLGPSASKSNINSSRMAFC